jgi:hypothetical protein
MSQTTATARFTKVIEYRDEDITISFVPTKGVPGSSHRVNIIDNRTRQLVAHDWLSVGVGVTEKVALYFYAKHLL